MISLFPGIPSAPAACCSPEAIILCVRLHKWLLWILLRASGGNGYQSKMNSSDKKGFLFMQTFLTTKNERGKKKENRIHGSDGRKCLWRKCSSEVFHQKSSCLHEQLPHQQHLICKRMGKTVTDSTPFSLCVRFTYLLHRYGISNATYFQVPKDKVRNIGKVTRTQKCEQCQCFL